ncbi:hypothetical protein [uncultured Parabacteroides sp.]|nr:hypothetical protein [uncultured Parabacteroides sp.]
MIALGLKESGFEFDMGNLRFLEMLQYEYPAGRRKLPLICTAKE